LLWLVILGIGMSAVSLYYYLVLLKQMYVLEPDDSAPIATPRIFHLTAGAAAVLVLYLGVNPGQVLSLIEQLLSNSTLVAGI
jgi:NADH-quinone oxidoreductase subunit N